MVYNLKELSRCYACFQQNELYEVELCSKAQNASYIEDMINDCNKIMSEFEARYGCYVHRNNFGGIHTFEGRNDEFLLASITIGTKTIKAYLRQSDGYHYSYLINISNSSFPKKKYVPSEEEIENRKKENEITKEIIDNSF